MTWKFVKLGDVCDLKNGFAFKSKLFKDKGLPILRISNIQNERIDTRRLVYFNPSDYKINFKKYEIKNGDLLIAMSGATTGKIGFNDSQTTFYLNQRVGKLVPSKDLNKKYLYYILSTKVEENLKISKGAAQPNLSSEQIKNINISLPALEEQKSIVEKFDTFFAEIDKVIAITNKNIENTNALFENYLVKYFSNNKYKQIKLEDVCTATQGVQISKSNQIKSFKKGYLRYLYISDFSNNKNIKYVENKYPKKIVRPSDIIVANTGASAGSIFRGIEGILSNNLFKVSSNKKLIESDFLYYFVVSKLFKNFQKKIMRGAANPHMGHENFLKTPLNLPHLDEQKEIISKIFRLEKNIKTLKQNYSNKIYTFRQLKLNFLSFNLNNTKAA